jgi:hypothetical protein
MLHYILYVIILYCNIYIHTHPYIYMYKNNTYTKTHEKKQTKKHTHTYIYIYIYNPTYDFQQQFFTNVFCDVWAIWWPQLAPEPSDSA